MTDPCTIGDAQALLQVMPIPVIVMRPRGIERPKLLDYLGKINLVVQRKLVRIGP